MGTMSSTPSILMVCGMSQLVDEKTIVSSVNPSFSLLLTNEIVTS